MSWGIDTPSNTSSQVNCLKTATINGNPISFVVRYYNTNVPSKNLTLSEAQALSTNGFYIVSVWENGFPTSQSYFTNAQGQSDGYNAFQYAQNQIGQPGNTPVYFAVDYDAVTSADQSAILAYFQGVQQGRDQYLTYQRGNGLPAVNYNIGVYGSGQVLSWCQAQPITSFYWQAMATGWMNNGTQWPNDNLRQHAPTPATVCGMSVDANESFPIGGGGWKV